jgi:GR25 family glycosyltransferase involved in LPS biosynthesis
MVIDNYSPEDFDFVDKIIFINLKQSTDRLKHMKEVLKFIPDRKIVRLEAIKHKHGHLGCCKSHIACLNMAIVNKWKNVLILEDDAKWHKYNESVKVFRQIYENNKNFDVIKLGTVGGQFDEKTYRLYHGQTATAYLVNNHYFKKLRDLFLVSEDKLTEAIDKDPYERYKVENEYAVDQVWKRYQKTDNWYVVNPALVIQKTGSSVINGGVYVDYTSYFNL